jgi:hypothetical protein
MNISIITTINHNVGDDFVREGIVFLLKENFRGKELRFEAIHKHSPITARHGFEWFRNQDYSLRVDKLLPLWLTRDRILEADLVVQSGAPVYWCNDELGWHCSVNEWYGPLIRRRFARNRKARLINLAAGTCQRYHSDGSEFMQCEQDKKHIREFHRLSAVTTVRDTLSQNILSMLDIKVPLIPCTSIFAIDEYGMKNEGDEYVAVNFMKGGGHYTFGQNIDFDKWANCFSRLYYRIKETENIVFVCHDKKEINEALAIDRNAKYFFSDRHQDYMKFYARAKYGILNRVHGAFLLASYGKPSVVIGSDTRARMVSEIGIKSHFVSDVSYEELCNDVDSIRGSIKSYRDIFNDIKQKAHDKYMEALSNL